MERIILRRIAFDQLQLREIPSCKLLHLTNVGMVTMVEQCLSIEKAAKVKARIQGVVFRVAAHTWYADRLKKQPHHQNSMRPVTPNVTVSVSTSSCTAS